MFRSGMRPLHDLKSEFVKLFSRYGTRRTFHQGASRGGLGKGDHVTQRPAPSQLHDDSIQAQRETAVRRCAVLKRFK